MLSGLIASCPSPQLRPLHSPNCCPHYCHLPAPPHSQCCGKTDPSCKAGLRGCPLRTAASGSPLWIPHPTPQAGVCCLAPGSPSPLAPGHPRQVLSEHLMMVSDVGISPSGPEFCIPGRSPQTLWRGPWWPCMTQATH